MARRAPGRGGRRDPGTRQPPSGPGPYSSRTDGQKIQGPDLDRPDVQFGEREMAEQGQRAVPIPRQQPPQSGGGGAPAQQAPPPLSELRGGLPPFLSEGSNFPDEPVTAGLEVGPGQGPDALTNPPVATDDFEMLLEYLVRNYSDEEAANTLREMRGGAAGSASAMPPSLEISPPLEDEFEGAGLGEEDEEFTEFALDEEFAEEEGELMQEEPGEAEMEEDTTTAEAVAEEVPPPAEVAEPAETE